MMKIERVQMLRRQPHSDDIVEVVGQDFVYHITATEMEKYLVDSEQMCGKCHDTGEVDTMESIYPGEPHMGPVGSRPCDCRIKEDEE